MKPLLLTLLFLLPALPAFAADEPHAGHDHDKKIRGPHGGRILEVDDYHAEVYVNPERRVAVFFYDEDMQPVELSEASGEIIAQAADRKKLPLAKEKDYLLTADALPEGEGYQLVVRLKPTAASGFNNQRFVYDAAMCGGCKLAEYACICEGHDH